MESQRNEHYYYAYICNDVVMRHPEYYGLKCFSTYNKRCHFVKDVEVSEHGMESSRDFPIIVKVIGRNVVQDVVTGEEYKATSAPTSSYELSIMLGDKLTNGDVFEYSRKLNKAEGVEIYTEAIDKVKETLANLNKDLNQRKLTKTTIVAAQ